MKSQTDLKVIGHHTYVRPKLIVIGHFVRQSCKRYFIKACNKVLLSILMKFLSMVLYAVVCSLLGRNSGANL